MINTYIQHILDDRSSIIQRINRLLEDAVPSLRTDIIDTIKWYASKSKPHYVLTQDANQYDDSGVLVERGEVSKDQTISDFLSSEYTGDKIPTYYSGSGWHYTTYADDLNDYLDDQIVCPAIYASIRQSLVDEFGAIDDATFADICDDDRISDELYYYLRDTSDARTFALCDTAIRRIGIADMLLRNL